jgi:hypothetical protein
MSKEVGKVKRERKLHLGNEERKRKEGIDFRSRIKGSHRERKRKEKVDTAEEKGKDREGEEGAWETRPDGR